MKRLATRNLVLILLPVIVLAACSSDDDKTPVKPSMTVTPAPVAWQRAQTAISQDLFSSVRLTGMLRLHNTTVTGVAFSPTGTRLASAGADRTTVIWNLANGESLFVESDTDGKLVFFGPTDDILITVTPKGFTRIWSADIRPPRELEEITSFEGYGDVAPVVAQSPDRSLLAFGSESGGIKIWRIPDAETVLTIPTPSYDIHYLAFSPDGRMLTAVTAAPSVHVWSIPGGELVFEKVPPDEPEDEGEVPDEGENEPPAGNEETLFDLSPVRARFSPDSSQLAVANITNITLYDLATGDQGIVFATADSAASNELVFSPDGRLLVGCGPHPVIGVWDTTNGDLLGGLPLPGQTCANTLFSPDGKLLLTLPSPGHDVFLWDIANITQDVTPEEKELRRRNRQNMGLYPGARFFDTVWSEDGRFIVLVDELGPLYIISAGQ
ncbi:MAG: hypothetical protein JW966_05125 [Anaerolineae bacterium]|nr:hypothetical protein [Anaerolineae bacterium]